MEPHDLMPGLNFRKKHSILHDPMITLGFSSFEWYKRSIKDRCNKIIGHYENIDSAESACLLINSLST
jgi:hypothetical protein